MDPHTEDSSISINDVSHLVQNLCVSLSMFSLYAPDHPVVQSPLNNFYSSLTTLLVSQEVFHLFLSDGIVLFEGIPLEEKNPVIKKFVSTLSHYDIKSISFLKGVQLKEISQFFKIITDTSDAGGNRKDIIQKLKELSIIHIRINDSEYRIISRNEKVVDVNTIIAGHATDENSVKHEILETLIDEIIERDEDILKILMDVRNNPTSVADHIITSLEGYERGEVDRDTIITKLIKNIERVGESLDKMEESGTISAEAMAKSLASLEVELKTKGKTLHTKEAHQFINKVTNLVASYADTSRAEQVIHEFVKHEKSFSKAELMMNEVAPTAAINARLLSKIEELMKKQGLNDSQLEEFVEQQMEKQVEKKKKKITKKFKPLSDRITAKLEKSFKNLNPEQEEAFIGYLDRTLHTEVKRAVKNVTEEMEANIAYQQKCRSRIADVFSGVKVGVAVIDDQHRIVQVINNMYMPDLHEGDILSSALQEGLKTFIGKPLIYKKQTKITKVVMDDEKNVISFMFLPV